jgi:hypothetical protein
MINLSNFPIKTADTFFAQPGRWTLPRTAGYQSKTA